MAMVRRLSAMAGRWGVEVAMMVAEADSSAMRASNLAAFAKYIPALFKRLQNHVPETRLVENPDGSRDIEFRGQCLYDVAGDGTTGPDLARREIEALKGSHRHRVYLAPLSSKNTDHNSSLHVAEMLKKGVEDGITFLQVPNTDGAYHLVVLGLGLGYHLDELVKLTEPFSICIVEPNIDFLYHSLETFDWRSLLERMSVSPQSVSLILAAKADEIARAVRGHCRHANPAAVDSMLIVQSYANSMMDTARGVLAHDAHLIQSGLGFYQDEMEMVRASYFNLVPRDDFRLFKRGDKPIDMPAFIVGSGPSIDDDLDFIKANQDRAVIFSCGTALGVLLANGIRPDFQVQLENGEAPRMMLESLAKTYDFTGIRLLGSNTISPQTTPLFGERAYYMRQALAPYGMFSPGVEYSLERAGPTVTNTGLEAALTSGFKSFYLFGCDLGARSPERHHSRFSPYHMKERSADYDAAVVFAQSLPTKELGNFGGVVFSNHIMTWSRDAMESSIMAFSRGRPVYNCSDGLRIKNAKAQVSSGVRLPALKVGKADAVKRLFESWPEAPEFGFKTRWDTGDWRGRMHEFAGKLIEICEAEPERTQEFQHRMGAMLIPDHHRLPHFEEYCLRGTMFVSILSTDYYARRVHPPEKRSRFQHQAYQGVIDLIRMMLDQTDWFFDHIDELYFIDLKKALSEWTENRIPLPQA